MNLYLNELVFKRGDLPILLFQALKIPLKMFGNLNEILEFKNIDKNVFDNFN